MSDEPSGELGEVEARGDTYLSPWDDPGYWYGANPYEDEAYQYSYNYEFDGTYDTHGERMIHTCCVCAPHHGPAP